VLLSSVGLYFLGWLLETKFFPPCPKRGPPLLCSSVLRVAVRQRNILSLSLPLSSASPNPEIPRKLRAVPFFGFRPSLSWSVGNRWLVTGTALPPPEMFTSPLKAWWSRFFFPLFRIRRRWSFIYLPFVHWKGLSLKGKVRRFSPALTATCLAAFEPQSFEGWSSKRILNQYLMFSPVPKWFIFFFSPSREDEKDAPPPLLPRIHSPSGRLGLLWMHTSLFAHLFFNFFGVDKEHSPR